jgi:hypothetical protein
MSFESSDKSSQKNANLLPLHSLSRSELVWWPYQSLSKSLLQTHHNASALIEINRRLADEMRHIARREQDFIFELSERILNRKSESDAKAAEAAPIETVDEIFESAISGLRQFNQAVIDAQIRSIEAFRHHAHEAVDHKPQAQAAE